MKTIGLIIAKDKLSEENIKQQKKAAKEKSPKSKKPPKAASEDLPKETDNPEAEKDPENGAE